METRARIVKIGNPGGVVFDFDNRPTIKSDELTALLDMKCVNKMSDEEKLVLDTTIQHALIGNPEAQLEIGYRLVNGCDGFRQNYKEALRWFEYASKNDVNGFAAFNIGVMYEYGRSVPQNQSKKIEYFLKSAERGCVQAFYALGVCYMNGSGVEADMRQCLTWLKKAALADDTSAQSLLGNILSTDIEDADRIVEATKWLKKAAAKGDAPAQYGLARVLLATKGLTPKVERLLNNSARQGYSSAISALELISGEKTNSAKKSRGKTSP